MFSVEIQIFKTYSHLFYWWASQNVNTDYIPTIESNYKVLNKISHHTYIIYHASTFAHSMCTVSPTPCTNIIVGTFYVSRNDLYIRIPTTTHAPTITPPATHDMVNVKYSSR